MANTTFNGPVRSQNGFEQLVSGVWTPVGGGTGPTTIPYVAGATAYTLTGITQPGDSKSFNWAYHLPAGGDSLSIAMPTLPGIADSLFAYLFVDPSGNVQGNGTGPLTISVAQSKSIQFTVTYSSNLLNGGLLYAVLSVTGFRQT